MKSLNAESIGRYKRIYYTFLNPKSTTLILVFSKTSKLTSSNIIDVSNKKPCNWIEIPHNLILLY